MADNDQLLEALDLCSKSVDRCQKAKEYADGIDAQRVATYEIAEAVWTVAGALIGILASLDSPK